jgi:predicted CopG family antitoxin
MSTHDEYLNGDAAAKARQRKTVTLADDVVELGERLAKEENRNFSNYVETLILRDAGRVKVAGEVPAGEEVAA